MLLNLLCVRGRYSRPRHTESDPSFNAETAMLKFDIPLTHMSRESGNQMFRRPVDVPIPMPK